MTGTDTGVGKTWLTCRLLEHWASESRAGLKVAESGVDPAVPTDDELLFQAAGGTQPERCRYRFAPAVAPGVAATDQGLHIDFDRIAEQVEALSTRSIVIAEGAGGWMVPMGGGRTIADLARRLGLPVLVVGRSTLGTINHSVLTHDAVVGAGLRCAAVVLNARAEDDLDSARRNRDEIAALVRAPVVLVRGEVDELAALLRG